MLANEPGKRFRPSNRFTLPANKRIPTFNNHLRSRPGPRAAGKSAGMKSAGPAPEVQLSGSAAGRARRPRGEPGFLPLGFAPQSKNGFPKLGPEGAAIAKGPHPKTGEQLPHPRAGQRDQANACRSGEGLEHGSAAITRPCLTDPDPTAKIPAVSSRCLKHTGEPGTSGGRRAGKGKHGCRVALEPWALMSPKTTGFVAGRRWLRAEIRQASDRGLRPARSCGDHGLSSPPALCSASPLRRLSRSKTAPRALASPDCAEEGWKRRSL